MEEKYCNVSLSAQGMYPQDLDFLRMNSEVELMTSKAVASTRMLFHLSCQRALRMHVIKLLMHTVFYLFLFEFWENKTK